MSKQTLLAAFAGVTFHISDLEEGECRRYCVASFGSEDQKSDLADLLSFDEFNEFNQLDNLGNVELSDNGCPFKSVQDVIKTLLEVFKMAIEEGLVTAEQIKGQCQVWPEGVSRSVFN